MRLKNPIPKRVEAPVFEPRKTGVSVSGMQTFLSCREKARLKYVCGIQSSAEKLALILGDAGHKILDIIYCGMRDEFFDSIEEAKAAVDKRLWFLEKKALSGPSAVKAQMMQDNILPMGALLYGYLDHYWEQDLKKKWTHVEDEFSVDIDGIPFRGTVDGAYINKKGRTWLLETKFKSRWEDSYVDGLLLDLQIAGYIVSLQEQGLDPEGCTFNIVRKPQLRKKQGETKAAFQSRISKDIQKRPTFYFERHDIQFSKEDKAIARRRLSCVLQEFCRWADKASSDERDLLFNAGACDNKYGACENLPICAHDDYSGHLRGCKPKS